MTNKLINISELAALVDGDWCGQDVAVCNLGDVRTAGPGMLAYIDSERKTKAISQTKASALIVPRGIRPLPLPTIEVSNPALAAAIIHNFLLSKEFVASGIDSRAVIGSGCIIQEDVSVAPMVVIGDKVKFTINM